MKQSLKQMLRNLVENLPEDCTWSEFHYQLYVAKGIEQGLSGAENGRGCTIEEVQEMFKQWQCEWAEHPQRRYVRVESREQLIDHLYRIRDQLGDHDPGVEVNQSTDRFLEALGAWLGVCDGYYRSVGRAIDIDEPSWQIFADVLAEAIAYQ